MKYIQRILDIAKEKQIQDYDTVFLIVGAEGSSKSHLALNCLEYLGGTADKICLDQNDFVEGLQACEDEDTIVFDEAGDGLFSRDFSSNMSKQLVKAFMVIRGKRLITFLVLPTFFMIDVYFRKHRVRGLFGVYKRGRVGFFSKKKIEKILRYGEKSQNIWVTKPDFVDTFPIYKGPMMEEYKRKKKHKISETLKGMMVKNSKAGTKSHTIKQMILQGVRPTDISKITGSHLSYVSMIKNKMQTEMLSVKTPKSSEYKRIKELKKEYEVK